jgi:hypothetical protein
MNNEMPPRIFGFGEGGLPAEIDALFKGGWADRIALEIIDGCQKAVDHRIVEGERRRRSASDRLAELNTLAYALIAWHAKFEKALPPIALTALAHVLGLISPSTGKPIASPTVMERLGLPAKIKKIDAFLEAARLDGEAEARGKILSIAELAASVGIERATLRSWRKTSRYQARKAIAGMAPSVYEKWNQARRPPQE